MSFNLNDVPYNIEDVSALEQELSAGSAGSGSPYPSIRSGAPVSPGSHLQAGGNTGRHPWQGRVVSDSALTASNESFHSAVTRSPAPSTSSQKDRSPGPATTDAMAAAHWKAVRSKLDAKRGANANNDLQATQSPPPPQQQQHHQQQQQQQLTGEGGSRRRSHENDPLLLEQQQQRRRVSSMLTSPVISRQSHGTGTPGARPISSHSDITFDVANPANWTQDRVLQWLETNGFGQDWQETFRRRQIAGEEFLGLTSYLNVRKVTPANVHAPDAGAKLCNAVRRLLERHESGPRRELDPAEQFLSTSRNSAYSNPEAAKSTASLAPETDLQLAGGPPVRIPAPAQHLERASSHG